jgi:hypothetical protein
MSLGVVRQMNPIQLGDSAELYAALRVDEQPVNADQIAQVMFTVKKPDGTVITDIGIIGDDGRGFYRWTATTEVGLYTYQAQFSLVSGEIRSVTDNFVVEDPFVDNPNVVGTTSAPLSTSVPITAIPANALLRAAPAGTIMLTDSTGVYTQIFTSTANAPLGAMTIPVQLTTPSYAFPSGSLITADPSANELITAAVWLRLEDCFDSIEGGPWLRDKTLLNFDEAKIAAFIPEALMEINNQMPPTALQISNFTAWSVTPGDNPNMPLLVQGTLVKTIKHLMRSYTEQPQPQGAQVVWHDRTRYTQMWQAVYQVEYKDYMDNVRLWKRTGLNLGHSALSVFNKSGRMWPYSNQVARGAYRGYF